MAFKDLFLSKKDGEEEIFKCEKCGKEKKRSEGIFMLEGAAFCCKRCCQGQEKGENKNKKDNVCEFC